MNVHIFQHVPFEGPGHLETLLKVPGNHFTFTRFYEDHKLPFVDICDLLIVMGGPMSVNDEKQFKWLKKEKEFIEKAISKNKNVVGICLGAQMIASVLGSKVYKNDEKEIGWMDVNFDKNACKQSKCFKDFSGKFTTFHWHGETFDMPSGAIPLAESTACKNQAFEYNNHVVGLQFHMEIVPETIEGLLVNCSSDLTKGKFIQTETQVKDETFLSENHQAMEKIILGLIS